MRRVRPALEPLPALDSRPRSPLEAAYEQYRLERRAELLSEATLQHYDWMLGSFLSWAREVGIRRFQELEVEAVREYRVQMAQRTTRRGRRLQPETLFDVHRALITFFRWAQKDGYRVDPRILELRRPRLAWKEPTLFHFQQLEQILRACNPRVPTEELVIRILVGSGLRVSELCGLSLLGPDGLSDLMLDSLSRGRAELRVRWDAGTKGKRSRRVPIHPKLAVAIKRYQARQRPDVQDDRLLISEHGRPYLRNGIDSIMQRLQHRVGFRVHAHAFRHTFATVATKLGWNFEHLRAAMGHADYKTLQRYIRLASERDLGRREDWITLIAANPAADWF
jgi:site-specific recombinase XerD